MGGKRPDKKELAQMAVMETLGHTPTAIAKSMGRSHHTVIKHLQSPILDDPEVKSLVDLLVKQELQDLTLINAKAREALHRYLDDVLEGRKDISNPIPLVAVIDRTWQQRRILEDKSTEIIDNRGLVRGIREIMERLDHTETVDGDVKELRNGDGQP
jgi:hypothetical protein